MIYVIHGQEQCFIEDKINQILKENKDSEIIRYDGSDRSFNIDLMLESCISNSLFNTKNVVLVNQPFFLIKKIEDSQYERLEKYVNDPIYETDLVLYTYLDNFNSRLKTFKLFSGNAQIITCNSLDNNNFNNYVRQRLNEEGLKMNNDSISLLSNICKRSATLLNQNIELLKLYPDNIDTRVIANLCTVSDNNDSFELINALTAKDITRAISLERAQLKDNDNIFGLIALLSTQLRFLYHVAYLYGSGKSKYDIAELTGSKEYRITMALKTLENLNSDQILELLAKLSELDIRCKSDSSISDISRFELFIMNLLRGNHAVN